MAAPSTRPSNDDRIRAALWFAERGFGIFPVWSASDTGTCRCPQGASCSSPGKHPITPQGFQDATHDPVRIKTFLSAPSAPNYGLVCPEGVFALDVDGEDGPLRLRELEEKHGPLPPTLRTATANGLHIFLRWPEGHPRPLRQMFGLVTRWGSGKLSGYVIGPRSVHPSGFAYAPTDDAVADIAELPEDWAIATTSASGSVTIHGRPTVDAVAVGQRHDHLRDTARLYAGTVRDPDALFAAVWAENEKLPTPKSEDEVRRAIGDVLERFGPDPVEVTEDGAVQRIPHEELDILPPAIAGDFPADPDPVAFEGLIGSCVETMSFGTDASLAGLLASFLAVCGAMVPAHAYNRGDQSSSPFLALVGESSIGRKGTAMNRALDTARLTWQADHVNSLLLDGLNSGEALVTSLHERKTSPYNVGKPIVALVFEEEYSAMLASRTREGSTLDMKLRVAFDGGSLSNRKASDSRVVVPRYWLPALAAITPAELRERIEPNAIRTGSANRWLYVPVIRRSVIPPDEPPVLDADQQNDLIEARGSGYERSLRVDTSVSRRLSEYAEDVIAGSSGVALDLVKRYQTIAFRIALVHAAVERSSAVTMEHLERALALTEYARRGVSWVFGQTVGSPDADLLLRHLQDRKALRQHAITRHIIRDPIRRQRAIDELVRLGYARVVKGVPDGGGRPWSELWLDETTLIRPFRPTSSLSETQETGLDVDETPRLHAQTTLTEGLDETWTKRGRIPGRNVDETARNSEGD